jgi:imidazolonepropionase-like amidohydrolase
LALLDRAGLSGEALLAAATWRAAELLGLPAGYGRLEPDAKTDLVWFREDPIGGAFAAQSPLGAVLEGRLVFASSGTFG